SIDLSLGADAQRLVDRNFPEKNVFRIYGNTREGHSVCAHILGFDAFLYAVPRRSTGGIMKKSNHASLCAQLKSALNEQLNESFFKEYKRAQYSKVVNVSNAGYGASTSSSHQPDEGFEPYDCVPEVSIVYRKPFIKYDGKQERPFFKISLALPDYVNKVA